jgi:hypothetical protein
MKPDYAGGSIVNLMASVAAACGVPGGVYPQLKGLDSARLRAARSLVLLVIDGLGYQFLSGPGSGSELARHLEQPITSVFPSTTASAITTFHTGVAPQQHAQTGWFTYFRELGAIAASLPLRPRYGGPDLASANLDLSALFPAPPLAPRLGRRCHALLPRALLDSPYTRLHIAGSRGHGFKDLPDLFAKLGRLVRRASAPQYIFAYWPKLDALAHDHGTGTEAVAQHFAQIDGAFSRFMDQIAGHGALVLVTADHGFVDTSPEQVVHLADHPILLDALALPLCGEPRAAYCYLRPGRERAFADYVGAELAGQGTLWRSSELAAEHWFGLGEPHPHLLRRIGDFTLLMAGRHVVKDTVLGEKPFGLIGVHGGVSPAEMLVPLVIAGA